jgi:hypothetical protein
MAPVATTGEQNGWAVIGIQGSTLTIHFYLQRKMGADDIHWMIDSILLALILFFEVYDIFIRRG